MKLPNADRAVIDQRKLREYLLSDSHPVGRFKARYFRSVGFSAAHWQALEASLRALATEASAEKTGSTDFGQKYMISGILTASSGTTSEVVTVWIIHFGDDRPHLVTVYPR